MSDNSIFFSIVIPTYNRANLIVKTLKSVFDQTFDSFEVIVVDNYSTDNTKEVLAPYIHSGKIKFIQHDQNYERAKSRNTGMENAVGEYVTFLDSDDIMYKHCLVDASTFIKNSSYNYKIFHNLYHLTNSEGKIVYKPRFYKLSNPIKTIANGNFLSCIGVFIHKEIYQNLKFDTNPVLTGFEDWEYWLRVLAYYPRLGRINKINCTIIDHAERTVNNVDVKKINERSEYILNKLQEDPYLFSIYKNYLKRFKAVSYLYIASMSNLNKMRKIALDNVIKALKKDTSIILKIRFWRILQMALINF